MNFLSGWQIEGGFGATAELILARGGLRQGGAQGDGEIVAGLHVIVMENFAGMETVSALDGQRHGLAVGHLDDFGGHAGIGANAFALEEPAAGPRSEERRGGKE